MLLHDDIQGCSLGIREIDPHLEALSALGAQIEHRDGLALSLPDDPHRIIVFGDRTLRPPAVESPYIIRAAVALYMVAASIEGQSTIHNADPIRRAHPKFVEHLQGLGADVHWQG